MTTNIFHSNIIGSKRTLTIGSSGDGVILIIKDPDTGNRLGIRITKSDAWDLIDTIITQVGERPKAPTAREQFDALPVGTVFRYESDEEDTNDRVKITQYWYTYIRPNHPDPGPNHDVRDPNHWFNTGGNPTIIIKGAE